MEKTQTGHEEYFADKTVDLKGVPEDKVELYRTFAAKDEAWKQDQTKKLLRKVDLRLLPILVIMYLLNFLDRSNLAQARLGGIEKDLKMKGTDFNLATSILFVGYLTMQLPSNLLITRVRPSIYLGSVMMVWGVVSASQAAVKSFGGLLVARIMLGVTEAPFFPGAIMLISSFYTRAELAHRIAWFYSGNSLANMFGGLIAAGVLGNLDGAHGIAGWRWLFIIEGVITVAFAFASM
jgi:MFS family permease